jgi:hypothetical protein
MMVDLNRDASLTPRARLPAKCLLRYQGALRSRLREPIVVVIALRLKTAGNFSNYPPSAKADRRDCATAVAAAFCRHNSNNADKSGCVVPLAGRP